MKLSEIIDTFVWVTKEIDTIFLICTSKDFLSYELYHILLSHYAMMGRINLLGMKFTNKIRKKKSPKYRELWLKLHDIHTYISNRQKEIEKILNDPKYHPKEQVHE